MIELKRDDILFFIMIVILILLSFFIVRSFIIPLIFSIVLVHLLNPLYKKIKKYLKFHAISSLIIILLFFLIFIFPVAYAIFNVTAEFGFLDNENLLSGLNEASSYLGIGVDLGNTYEKALLKINDFIDNLFYKIPEFIFHIFLIIFFYYYFSKDYNQEIGYLKSIFDTQRYSIIIENTKKLLNGIVYGQIFVRFVQALLGTIGFIIIGVEGSLFLGLTMFFAAFLPLIGTGLVWGPLAISYLLMEDYSMMIFVLLIGAIISTVDNILLPYVISERSNIGPVLTLISIIGGLQLFGFYGVILGPLFVGILFVMLEEIFSEIKKSNSFKRASWSQEDREKFRKLKSNLAKEQFLKLMEDKYSRNNSIGRV